MDHIEEYSLAESADTAPRVKSPSYSPKLEDDEDSKIDPPMTAPSKADVVSSSDFRNLLSSLPSSVSTIQSAYDNLLSLYQYTLSRLHLLELIGANGVLTDALILRLQQLNDENDRLLASERANRSGLADFKQRLDELESQNKSSEAALHDAHQLLQQQEEELEAQTKAIQELKDKLAAERKSNSRHTTERSGGHRSRRSTHDDTTAKEVDRGHRHREERSHRSDSHRHRETDRDAHRHERESSITSSRHSSSRRREERSKHEERRHSHVDRIYEDEVRNQTQAETSPSRTFEEDDLDLVDSNHPPPERQISINGAAAKSTNGSSGITPNHAESSKSAISQSQTHEEEDYEPEIDLGEDLLAEDVEVIEEAPTVKPAPPVAPREYSREHNERDKHHRSSHRTRSRSPTRDRRHDTETAPRKHHRGELDEKESENKTRSPTRPKRDVSPPRGPRADINKNERGKEPETSSSSRNAPKSRNTSMFGRLGLPLAGNGASNGQGGEGGRTSLAIRGAGRSNRQAK